MKKMITLINEKKQTDNWTGLVKYVGNEINKLKITNISTQDTSQTNNA